MGTESERALAGRAHADHDARRAETARALRDGAAGILRTVILLNGAAASATLFFMTEVIGTAPTLARALVIPLSLFGFGLTVASFATGFSYFADTHRGRALEHQERAFEMPYLRDTAASREAEHRARFFDGLGFGAVFVGMGAAVLGFAVSAWLLVRTG